MPSQKPLPVRESDVVERVLKQHRTALGTDFHTYRNHVYRGLNYQLALLERRTPTAEMALAWAVHDLGIWTAGTFDYLGPSMDLARAHAEEAGVRDLPHVLTMIALHHKVRPAREPETEAFRRADLLDVLRGLPRPRSGRVPVRVATRVFPYRGFQSFLLRQAALRARRHPLSPLPMIRW